MEDDSEEMASSRRDGADACRNSETLTAHTRPAQVQTTHNHSGTKGSGHKVPPLTKMLLGSYLQWMPDRKKKINVL